MVDASQIMLIKYSSIPLDPLSGSPSSEIMLVNTGRTLESPVSRGSVMTSYLFQISTCLFSWHSCTCLFSDNIISVLTSKNVHTVNLKNVLS